MNDLRKEDLFIYVDIFLGIGFRKMLLDRKLKREDLPENQSQYLKPKGTPPFVKLLRAISEFKEIKIIRFLSSNP